MYIRCYISMYSLWSFTVILRENSRNIKFLRYYDTPLVIFTKLIFYVAIVSHKWPMIVNYCIPNRLKSKRRVILQGTSSLSLMKSRKFCSSNQDKFTLTLSCSCYLKFKADYCKAVTKSNKIPTASQSISYDLHRSYKLIAALLDSPFSNQISACTCRTRKYVYTYTRIYI